MKVIKEQELTQVVNRTYDKGNNIAKIYVTECARLYLVTIQLLGYACPSVYEWKAYKKEAKTMDEAVRTIIAEAIKRGNI